RPAHSTFRQKEVPFMPNHETANSPLPLTGKIAIVTGSGRGIGAATAVHLAELGADVVINYRNNVTPAEEVHNHIRSAEGRAIVVRAYAGTEEGTKSLAAAALSEFGRRDILVSNAGPLFRPIPLTEMTWEEFGGNVDQDLRA